MRAWLDKVLAWCRRVWVDWFRDSEVIFLSRLLAVSGAMLELLQAVNLAPILPDRLQPWYMVATGLLFELARHRRATDL